jgi:hypothetical protein
MTSMLAMGLQTEYEFTLPMGYVDGEGNLHRQGVMRLATAADEILPLKDPRVQSNPAYLIVILLSRVISNLGTINSVNPGVVESLFAGDLSYLQDFYNQINLNGNRVVQVNCPHCQQGFELELERSGES